MKKIVRRILILLLGVVVGFLIWQFFKTPATEGDWQEPLAVQARAEFSGDIVLIKNIRNFRYGKEEKNVFPDYYNQIYDLRKLEKVWYVVDPFKEAKYAAHTFLSFEFSDKKYITISIEARKLKGQQYSIWQGLLRTYPLMYIVADERDAILMRTNIRKDNVYMYPVKISQEKARLLFEDMLLRMNDLAQKPVWYNTISANCTSSIAYHINKIWPGKLPVFLWQSWVTGYAEKLAFDKKLLDTDLNIQDARKKYFITEISQKIGDARNYSELIRKFLNDFAYN